MTKFEDVLQDYEKKKLKRIADESAKEKQETAEQAEFSRLFQAAVKKTVNPIFNEFSTEARRHGFPSAIKNSHDENGNPFIQVRFFPERYTLSNVDTSRDCSFILLGDLAERKVKANTRFLMRPDKDDSRKIAFTRNNISKATLNRQLYGFLHTALEAYEAS